MSRGFEVRRRSSHWNCCQARLTGVSMQAKPAVWTVLQYQVATYWLPVLPGRLSWRSLPHRGYV